MTFETSKFGGGSNTPVTTNVSNHYGPRATGGSQGVAKVEGGENQSVVNFDATGPLYDTQQIPADAVVTDIRGYDLTGSISAATVGAQDISLAQDDTDTTWVTITTAADLTVTGPTAGSVVVKWRYYA